MSTFKEQENAVIMEIYKKIEEDIVYDGIINEKEWNGKIKFILKEINEKNYSNLKWKYTLPELLHFPPNECIQIEHNINEERFLNNLKPTWQNIGRWTYGIHSIFDSGINSVMKKKWSDVKNNQEWLKEIQKVSIINIKKTPGVEKPKDKGLKTAIKEYGDLTWKQINLGSPRFVIFCGTGDFFLSEKLGEQEPPINEWKKTDKGFEYHKDMNTIYIKYWHPNAHFPDNMMYYTLMDIVSELREKNNV